METGGNPKNIDKIYDRYDDNGLAFVNYGGWLDAEINIEFPGIAPGDYIFETPALAAERGDTVFVPINFVIPSDTTISSMQFTFEYNSELLEVIGLEFIQDAAQWTFESNIIGSDYLFSLASTNLYTGNNTLFGLNVVINEQAEGILPLVFKDVQFDELQVNIQILNGELEVVEPIQVTLYGDVSLDGSVSALDGSLILKNLVNKIELTEQQLLNADVTDDGTLSALDASYILQYTVGLIENFPVMHTEAESIIAEKSVSSDSFEENNSEITVNLTSILEDKLKLEITIPYQQNLLGFEGNIRFDEMITNIDSIYVQSSVDSSFSEYSYEHGIFTVAIASSKPMLEFDYELKIVVNATLKEASELLEFNFNRIRYNENNEIQIDNPFIIDISETIAKPVTNIQIHTSESDHGVHLSWDNHQNNDITEYHIYRGKEINSMAFQSVVDRNSNTFEEKENLEGISFYSVRAVGKDGSKSPIGEIKSYFHEKMEVNKGWKLISLPVLKDNVELESSFSFTFNKVYQRVNVLEPGKGYWVRSDNGEFIQSRGEGISEKNIQLEKGWNLIGSIITSLSRPKIVDENNIISNAPIYSYKNGVYQATDILEPGIGYWLHTNDTGFITMSADDSRLNVSAQKSIKNNSLSINLSKLLFQTEGISQEIWISEQPLEAVQLQAYMLPPVAPAAILDVRTHDNYKVTDSKAVSIQIESSSYPVSIEYVSADESTEYVYRLVGIKDGNEVHINITPGRISQIDQDYDSLVLEKVHESELVQDFSIFQNYPNPFNPTTTIRYQIASQTKVVISVFDVAGRRVSTLVNEQQPTGVYTIQFDGSHLASGIYFLRFQTGSFVDVQKMTLIK